ncbi:hypothetical protein D4R42_04425 [bacterium]|nr:MAG: hypothetical protein D4R42_04425 [bacterium]
MPRFIVEMSREDLDTAKDASEMEQFTDAEYIQRTLEVIPLRSDIMELTSVKVSPVNGSEKHD